jgi:hypothetical protein
MNSVITKENLDYFVQGLADKSKAVVIGVKLLPLYAIIPDDKVAKIVHDYILNTYQYKMTGNRSLKYAVSGFTEEGTYGALDLPTIDTKLEYYSEHVPEISETELSTIIYSGNSYGVSHDVGFFIGSKTKKPGKLRKKSDGTFVYEPFEEMRDASQVSQIYVDANGDVKIAKTGSIDDYIKVQFESKNIKRYDFPVNTSNIYSVNDEFANAFAHSYRQEKSSFTRFNDAISYRSEDVSNSSMIKRIAKNGWIYLIFKSDTKENIDGSFKIYSSSYNAGTLTKRQDSMNKSITNDGGKYKIVYKCRIYDYYYFEEFNLFSKDLLTKDINYPFGKNKDGSAVWPEIYLSEEEGAEPTITPRWQ